MESRVLTIENLRRKNFAPEEFFVSETAVKLGVSNLPPKSLELGILPCLMSTADLMQEIRDLLGTSIQINSAYRCKIVNDAVGSKDSSQHRQGLACDFVSPNFGSPEKIVKFLHSKKLLVDQCFNEGSWVHVSRCLPKQVMNANPNRMMYGYYLPDASGKRIFNPL